MLIMSNSKSDQTVTGAWQTQEVIKKVPKQAIKTTSHRVKPTRKVTQGPRVIYKQGPFLS